MCSHFRKGKFTRARKEAGRPFRPAGKMPAVHSAGRMPAVHNAGKMPAVHNAGKMPAVHNAGRMRAVHMLAVLLGCILLLPSACVLHAESALRVCADPNNLPFSNARGEGFENK